MQWQAPGTCVLRLGAEKQGPCQSPGGLSEGLKPEEQDSQVPESSWGRGKVLAPAGERDRTLLLGQMAGILNY